MYVFIYWQNGFQNCNETTVDFGGKRPRHIYSNWSSFTIVTLSESTCSTLSYKTSNVIKKITTTIQYAKLRWDVLWGSCLQRCLGGAGSESWHSEMERKRGKCVRNRSGSVTFTKMFQKNLTLPLRNECMTESPPVLCSVFHKSLYQGAPLAVFWICSLRMRMLCRCSGGNMAICSGVSCRTCMIRAA